MNTNWDVGKGHYLHFDIAAMGALLAAARLGCRVRVRVRVRVKVQGYA